MGGKKRGGGGKGFRRLGKPHVPWWTSLLGTACVPPQSPYTHVAPLTPAGQRLPCRHCTRHCGRWRRSVGVQCCRRVHQRQVRDWCVGCPSHLPSIQIDTPPPFPNNVTATAHVTTPFRTRFPEGPTLLPVDSKARALARMFVKAADGSAGSLYGAIRNTGGCCGHATHFVRHMCLIFPFP